jgi:hypothetical protein
VQQESKQNLPSRKGKLTASLKGSSLPETIIAVIINHFPVTLDTQNIYNNAAFSTFINKRISQVIQTLRATGSIASPHRCTTGVNTSY